MAHDEGSPAGGQLLRRSTTVSFFTGLGVVAGFAVDVLIVARFGIGAETDAFFGAYTVPFILITRLAAVQPVLISVLADYRRDETVLSLLLNAAGLIALAVAGLGVLLAGPLVAATAPGFAPDLARLAAGLARILFARVPLAAIAEICKAELYSRRRFGLATASDLLPSLVTASVLILAGRRSSIDIVAWGFVLGALAQAGLLTGLLFGPLGLPYRPTLRHPAPVLGQTGRLLLAPLAGLFLRQGVTLAERILGSYLPAGSLTALSYANRLNTIVAGVFFDGITKASLPSLAERWRRGATPAGRAELVRLLKLMATVALPVGLAVAALSTPLVRLFFERGQVDPQAALLLGTVLGVYSLSLPFLGPFRAVQTFFYALKETRPIVVLLGGLAGMTVAFDLLLVWWLGAVGLALAYTLGCGLAMAAGLAWLARRAGDLDWRGLAGSTWRLALASAAMAATMLVSSGWLASVLGTAGRWGLALTLAASGLAGLAVFVVLGAVLRLEAISLLWDMVKTRTALQRKTSKGKG
jgi:putative peptidoglycan lipid II flippase